MADSSEQLVSFFLYSLFVYPVTNYIITTHKSSSRWRGALYAIAFLFSVSVLHMMYDNLESGPNHYQLLHVRRDESLASLKKAYRGLSLELHPDKNKAPDAADKFRKVKAAFDVLSDKGKRKEYNRLGDRGVAVHAQSVIDHKYILLQLVVYYCSSIVFAFLMTFSEPTGDAFSISLFGLTVMLLMEMVLILEEAPLPLWFLPYNTPCEIMAFMHRIFPAFMNGCRSITGSFYVDIKDRRVLVLSTASNNMRDVSVRISNITRSVLGWSESVMATLSDNSSSALGGDSSNGEVSVAAEEGYMGKYLLDLRKRISSLKEYREGTIQRSVADKIELISDPARLRRDYHQSHDSSDHSTSGVGFWSLLTNLSLYLLARYVIVKKQ